MTALLYDWYLLLWEGSVRLIAETIAGNKDNTKVWHGGVLSL
jgi:hypothetical protein